MEQNNTTPGTEQIPVNGVSVREIVIDDGFPPKAHPAEYLMVLRRYRWLLAAMVIGGGALIAAYLLVMPQTWAASATLLPPEKSESMSFGALLSKNAGLDLPGLSQNSSAEVFTKILYSRTLADSLVRRFDLIRKFGLPPGHKQRAADILIGGLEVTSDRHGIMQINYRTLTGFSPSEEEQREAAEFSAEIVNAATDLLDHYNREKQVTSSRRTREFLGRMIVVKRAQRDSIQAALLQFQQRHKAFGLNEQVTASVGALSDIQSQIMKKELELTAAQSEFAEENRTVALLRTQLAELRRQKSAIESGAGGGGSIGVDLRNLPDVARQYANLKLDLEVSTQVYSFLETQYHQEQVEEARDQPTIAVLDSAQVPEYRASPRRGLALAIALPILLLTSLFLVFIIDYYRRVMRTGRARRVEEIVTTTSSRRLEGTGKS